MYYDFWICEALFWKRLDFLALELQDGPQALILADWAQLCLERKSLERLVVDG